MPEMAVAKQPIGRAPAFNVGSMSVRGESNR